MQHLHGIPSLRQTAADIDVNIACRWFLGYRVSEAVPHFAPVSCNFSDLALEANTRRYAAYKLEQKALRIMDKEIICAKKQ